MIILFIIIILPVALIIQGYVAKQFQSVAADKGYQGDRFFHLSFWFGLPGWLLVIALPDRTNGGSISQAMPDSVAKPEKKEVFIWHPVDKATAVIIGETNIKCTNCRRVQFKGNKVCNQCGAKFTKIDTQELV